MKDNSSNMAMTAIVGVVAFVFGLIIGLPVLGWWLFPVEWIDAGPVDLAPAEQAEYVQMVADSFVLTGDVLKAQARVDKLGHKASASFESALTSTGVDNFRVSQLATVVTMPPAESTAGGSTTIMQFLVPVCASLLLLIVVAGGGVFVYLRFFSIPRSKAPPKPKPEVTQGTMAQRVETPAEIAAQAGPEPVTTFKTTYMLGNDLFDESFSIDDQAGDFLGECGVGIGETIGVGDPKKVTAFEVWLFDKNDIRTVTKVVMTEHAFNDEGLKSKLAAKGEPVMARNDGVVELETATLKVAARVVDMQYGSGALPPNSFFQQLTLEISAWKKSEG